MKPSHGGIDSNLHQKMICFPAWGWGGHLGQLPQGVPVERFSQLISTLRGHAMVVLVQCTVGSKMPVGWE